MAVVVVVVVLIKSFEKKRGAKDGTTTFCIRHFFDLGLCKDDSIRLHCFTVHILKLSVYNTNARLASLSSSSLCTAGDPPQTTECSTKKLSYLYQMLIDFQDNI